MTGTLIKNCFKDATWAAKYESLAQFGSIVLSHLTTSILSLTKSLEEYFPLMLSC